MAKIIKQGTVGMHKTKCSGCKTSFSYHDNEVRRSGSFGYNLVRCPGCGADVQITWSWLK